jgi:hypothetical protein
MAQRVWLAAFPRSGVTYLRHVIEAIYGLPTYTVYAGERASIVGLFDDHRRYPDDADSRFAVHFVKTHETDAAGGNGPAIHLVRDGRDAYVSLAHYRKDISGESGSLSDVMAHEMDAHSWAEHTLIWLSRPQTRLVRFDDLVDRPVETVRGAVESLALDVPEPNEAPDVLNWATLHKMCPRFWRAGARGSWRYGMPHELQTRFLATQGAALEALAQRTGND